MVKFKELSKLQKSEIDKRIKELEFDLVKARVSAGKGGKVKLRETKRTLARLLMLQKKNLLEEKS